MQYPNLSAVTDDCARRLEVQEAIIGFTVGLAWRTDGVWRSARSEGLSGLSNLREPPPPPCLGRGKWNSDFNLSRRERLQGDRVRMRREGEGRLKDLPEKYKRLRDCLGKWRPSLWPTIVVTLRYPRPCLSFILFLQASPSSSVTTVTWSKVVVKDILSSHPFDDAQSAVRHSATLSGRDVRVRRFLAPETTCAAPF